MDWIAASKPPKDGQACLVWIERGRVISAMYRRDWWWNYCPKKHKKRAEYWALLEIDGNGWSDYQFIGSLKKLHFSNRVLYWMPFPEEPPYFKKRMEIEDVRRAKSHRNNEIAYLHHLLKKYPAEKPVKKGKK